MADGRRRGERGIGSRARRRTARRGAAALEYILISALVAIALIAAFRVWGITLYQHMAYVVWDSSAALEEVQLKGG